MKENQLAYFSIESAALQEQYQSYDSVKKTKVLVTIKHQGGRLS